MVEDKDNKSGCIYVFVLLRVYFLRVFIRRNSVVLVLFKY